MAEFLLLEVENGIATLTMNRSEKLNALPSVLQSITNHHVVRWVQPKFACQFFTYVIARSQ